jgi:hypothetical protein
VSRRGVAAWLRVGSARLSRVGEWWGLTVGARGRVNRAEAEWSRRRPSGHGGGLLIVGLDVGSAVSSVALSSVAFSFIWFVLLLRSGFGLVVVLAIDAFHMA